MAVSILKMRKKNKASCDETAAELPPIAPVSHLNSRFLSTRPSEQILLLRYSNIRFYFLFYTVVMLENENFLKPLPPRLTGWLAHLPEDRRIAGCRYVHHRAGVAALLAAFPDEESAVPLPPQQVFCFVSVAASNIPSLLVMVGQILIIFYQRILAKEEEEASERGAHGSR